AETSSLSLHDALPISTQLRAVSYSDTTWCLLFNTQQPALGSALLRQALAAAASQASLPVDEGLYAPAKGLVPDGLAVGGIDYRRSEEHTSELQSRFDL